MDFGGNNTDLMFQYSDNDLDYAIALSLQEQINSQEPQDLKSVPAPKTPTSSSSSKPIGIVDPQWELIDPNPDIHALFLQYNDKFFWGKLAGIEVRWSPRMTTCAGLCCYEGRGRLCSVRLSLPLLKLRPRKDLVETLLHEMIHAYLFVTENNKDRDGHGPEFLSHMRRINKETGTNISVYHNFHDEVRLYKQHWWRCTGPCRKRGPFYGMVKRAMNRAPGPNDIWWSQHQATCDGVFEKVKEPENYKGSKRKVLDEPSTKKSSISNYFVPQNGTPSKIHKKNPPAHEPVFKDNFSLKNYPPPFSGNGVKLGSSSGLSSSAKPLSKFKHSGLENGEIAEIVPKQNYPKPFSGSGVKLGSSSGSKSSARPSSKFKHSGLKNDEIEEIVPMKKYSIQSTSSGIKLGSSSATSDFAKPVSKSKHSGVQNDKLEEIVPTKKFPIPSTGNRVELGSKSASSSSANPVLTSTKPSSQDDEIADIIPMKNYPTPFTGNEFKLGSSSGLSKSLSSSKEKNSKEDEIEEISEINYITPLTGNGIKLGSSSKSSKSLLTKIRQKIEIPNESDRNAIAEGWGNKTAEKSFHSTTSNTNKSHFIQSSLDKFISSPKDPKTDLNVVVCPICFDFCPEDKINQHLDACIQNST